MAVANRLSSSPKSAFIPFVPSSKSFKRFSPGQLYCLWHEPPSTALPCFFVFKGQQRGIRIILNDPCSLARLKRRVTDRWTQSPYRSTIEPNPITRHQWRYTNMKYRKNPGPADRADDVGVDVMGADLPQAFADEVTHPKAGIRRARAEQRSQQRSTNTSWILPFGIMMVLVLMASYFLVSQHEENLVKHLNRDKLLREQEMSHEFNIKYSELQEENSKLKGEIQQLLELQQQNENLVEERRIGQTEQQVLEKKVDHLTAYKKKMHENIQLMSKTALLEKQVSER
jgi:hypothetical protein